MVLSVIKLTMLQNLRRFLILNGIQIALLVEELRQFCWMGGFCLCWLKLCHQVHQRKTRIKVQIDKTVIKQEIICKYLRINCIELDPRTSIQSATQNTAVTELLLGIGAREKASIDTSTNQIYIVIFLVSKIYICTRKGFKEESYPLTHPYDMRTVWYLIMESMCKCMGKFKWRAKG